MLLLFAALLNLVHAADLVAIPGSEVRLPLEPGFVVASAWVGATNPETNGSVMVTRIEAPASQLVAGFTDEALAGQGVTVTARREVKLGGYDGVWLDGTQAGGQVAMAIVGDGAQAWLLKGLAFAPDDRPRIERMLQGASWGAMTAAKLLFDLSAPAGLVVAAEMQGSRIYTPDGTMGAGAGKPLFVVAPSVRPAAVSEETARGAVAKVAGLLGVTVESTMPVVHGGRRGWDVRGRGMDATTGTEMVVWQRMLFDADGSYFRLVGVAPLADAKRWVPAWEAAAATLRDAQ